MIKISVFLLVICQVSSAFATCLSDSQLGQLTQAEVAYLTQKIPPVFKHTLADKKIKVQIQAVELDGCKAQLVVQLPQADVDEANAFLDGQPAKKIMLAAQGYALPQGIDHRAEFSVNVDQLSIADADILQTAPLGKLRASVELMYAFLTQNRAQLSATQRNDVPWSDAIKQQELSHCTSNTTISACGCIVDQYALKIPEHQMEYIQYIRTNPYALAMGADQVYEEMKQNAASACAG
ncbi:MAG: hypothetical protein KFB94_05945 [Methylophilaceae bacterium]|nr:MAG: hypothetical protein KFB94_05945 [Methylophilaceae bacterium]